MSTFYSLEPNVIRPTLLDLCCVILALPICAVSFLHGAMRPRCDTTNVPPFVGVLLRPTDHQPGMQPPRPGLRTGLQRSYHKHNHKKRDKRYPSIHTRKGIHTVPCTNDERSDTQMAYCQNKFRFSPVDKSFTICTWQKI